MHAWLERGHIRASRASRQPCGGSQPLRPSGRPTGGCVVPLASLSNPGCVKTTSRIFVSAQFVGAIDEAVH